MSTTKSIRKKAAVRLPLFSWMPPVTALCRRRFCQVQKSSAQSASRSVLPRSQERVSYRSSTGCKLFDRCLEAIALRNDLTLGEPVPPAVLKPDAYILQPHGTCRFCRIIQKSALAHLAKSFQPKIISASTAPENTCTWICFRQRLRSSRSLATAQNDFDVARFAGFSEEEFHLLCESDGKDQGKYHAGARRQRPAVFFRYRNKKTSTNCFFVPAFFD